MSNPHPHITILGAGLLGGSLGMDIARIHPGGRVIVWTRSPETRALCEKSPWCSHTTASPAEACSGADLVFLCTPVDHIPALLRQIADACKEGAVVTDIGSTKREICQVGAEVFPNGGLVTFIGSHPMAGSEKSGLPHAREHLFAGHTCIVTPHRDTDFNEDKLRALTGFWESLGMRVCEMPPDEHDRLVAGISHLPHAAAAALIQTIVAASPPAWVECAGPGLRDTTRIAGGDPSLWTSIFLENRDPLLRSLDTFSGKIEAIRNALREKDGTALHQLLSEAQSDRARLEAGSSETSVSPSDKAKE